MNDLWKSLNSIKLTLLFSATFCKFKKRGRDLEQRVVTLINIKTSCSTSSSMRKSLIAARVQSDSRENEMCRWTINLTVNWSLQQAGLGLKTVFMRACKCPHDRTRSNNLINHVFQNLKAVLPAWKRLQLIAVSKSVCVKVVMNQGCQDSVFLFSCGHDQKTSRPSGLLKHQLRRICWEHFLTVYDKAKFQD